MTCPHCGQPCDETKPFCGSCGGMVNPGAVPPSLLKENRVREVLRQLASSRLYLTGMISYTLTAVFSFVSSLFADEIVAPLIGPLYLKMGITDEISTGGYVFSSLLSMLPTILILSGMWMMYASVKKGDIKTTGLSMLKGVSIFSLIVACLGIVLLLFMIGLTFLLIGLREYYTGNVPFEAVIALLSTLCILMLVLFTLLVVFYVKLLKTLNAIRHTVLTGEPDCGVSSFIIGWEWVIGVLNGIGFVFLLFFSPLLAISLALSSVTAISFALFLRKYRNEMRSIASENTCIIPPSNGTTE